MVANGRESMGRRLALLVFASAVLLAGCATRPGGRDGPEANPPPELARVPDAEPRVETIRPGGPNKPYEVLGQNYTPITQDKPFSERGLASWYGKKFHGKRTASGELYNMYAMTAAHPTLPIPSYARIRNPANGREVVVRVNDRGPFVKGRIIDLSYTAALKLDLLRGVAPVELSRITFDDIRTGAWRRDGSEGATRVAAGPAAGVVVAQADVAPVSAPAAAIAAPAVESPGAAAMAPPADSASEPATASPGKAMAAADASADVVVPAAAPVPSTGSSADAATGRAYTVPQRGFWVQLGAFRERAGAEAFQSRVSTELDWIAPLLAVFGDASIYRLQAGPYPSRDEARGAADRVRASLQLVPVIVERR